LVSGIKADFELVWPVGFGTCELALSFGLPIAGLTNWMAFFQLALEQLVYVLIGQKLL